MCITSSIVKDKHSNEDARAFCKIQKVLITSCFNILNSGIVQLNILSFLKMI